MTICLEYDDIVDTRDDESDKSYDTSETCTFPITFAVCCWSDTDVSHLARSRPFKVAENLKENTFNVV